ncbi:RsmE family RNA methyltransferase [Campylobacter ureolyticus ACS-301-V-Sch3b]|uniref:Ribosomal RNA small subunit methyltransferase E n=1 Tax=Campylobacter ureolyticus ACS-301-V-Sch3b TaxID=883165 RepID=S3YMV9_9BACT|nr:16S rRNA (uracil(1498)-N(3))-methyltransferase [Campylobacter ureolyticus]EPH09835.1 RsmE family RNA methyltransferase [Campylobacter ureolyticus ACS-301-V-Sch3b]
MVFLYDKNAGDELLKINDFKHLKARRVQTSQRIDIRNLRDNYNYIYEITEISKKEISLELVFKHSLPKDELFLNIAWAVVDPIVIEKTLPTLNEIGVKKIFFVYTEFSQKNFKLDLERFERILINSSQQCGRNSIIEFEIYSSFDEFLTKFDNIALVDFGGEKIQNLNKNKIYFIGPEGGFSENERLKVKDRVGLNSPFILKSNSAVVGIASKILL